MEDCVLYCGNLDDKVTEDLLYELFLQAGPLVSVKIPKDRSGRQKNFAFITFKHEVSVPYTIALFYGMSLYGRKMNLNFKSGQHMPNRYLEHLMDYKRATAPSFNMYSQSNFSNQYSNDYGNYSHERTEYSPRYDSGRRASHFDYKRSYSETYDRRHDDERRRHHHRHSYHSNKSSEGRHYSSHEELK